MISSVSLDLAAEIYGSFAPEACLVAHASISCDSLKRNITDIFDW